MKSKTPRRKQPMMTHADIPKPLLSHIKELRTTLIRALSIIALSTALSLAFYQDLFTILTSPFFENGSSPRHETLQHRRVHNRENAPLVLHLPAKASVTTYSLSEEIAKEPPTFTLSPGGYIDYVEPVRPGRLIILGPTDGIFVMFKTCFWTALTLSSPLWMAVFFHFIAPALNGKERSLIIPFIALSSLFLLLGALFAFYFTLPLANHALQTFNATIGENLWSVSEYLDYTVNLMLANGLAFECVVILAFLVHQGVLSKRWLLEKRRFAYVAILILSALLTPPDALTQILLAIPLIVLYEAVIFFPLNLRQTVLR